MAGAREAGKEIEEASLIGFKNTISSKGKSRLLS